MMENVPNKTKRPSSITLICVLGLVVTLEIFWVVLYPSISSTLQRLGLGFTLYLAFSAVTLLACMIGLWFMKNGQFTPIQVLFLLVKLLYLR
jgi:hypothetical protein